MELVTRIFHELFFFRLNSYTVSDVLSSYVILHFSCLDLHAIETATPLPPSPPPPPPSHCIPTVPSLYLV